MDEVQQHDVDPIVNECFKIPKGVVDNPRLITLRYSEIITSWPIKVFSDIHPGVVRLRSNISKLL